ncbi:MAG: response regulator, partial [Phycisphaerae bacterium]|nr:response regulator [Phycisphaerae bacterium]
VAGRGETLLVVEDDDHVRAIVTSSLRSRGYDVLQARDGAEAMQRLFESPGAIRLIALDLDLPRMSGEACLRELREAGVRIPVVVTTGSSELGVETSPQQDVHLLRKPFQMADLATMIRRVLAESRDQVGERI